MASENDIIKQKERLDPQEQEQAGRIFNSQKRNKNNEEEQAIGLPDKEEIKSEPATSTSIAKKTEDNLSRNFNKTRDDDGKYREEQLKKQEAERAGRISEEPSNDVEEQEREDEEKNNENEEVKELAVAAENIQQDAQIQRKLNQAKKAAGNRVQKDVQEKTQSKNIEIKTKEETKKKKERTLIVRILMLLTPCFCLLIQLLFLVIIIVFIISIINSVI